MSDSPPQILAVDDRPHNLLALERTLAGCGAELVKATSGEQALAATLERDFALAILDVQMPGMDGYELAGLLRGDPKNQHMPIVFLTAASAEQAQVFRGYESGAVDYIVKPYDPLILASKVRVFLEMDRARVELARHRDHLDALMAERTAELERTNRELRAEIAERRRAEARLEQAVQALQRSNQELEQFAYVASHDLQEPLRMVASYTQLLARRYQDALDEQAHEFIGYAVDGAQRLQALITSLLALSRVGTRGAPLEPTPCGEVAAEVLRGLELAIEEAGATVDVGPLPTVLADRAQLGQVLQNLIGNAIKFRGEAAPRVEVGARRDGQRWVLWVADNGIGIDPRYHERIFAIFQRLHLRGDYPGTGIGLSIVKKIVERHGGQMRVESAPGQGARFLFSLAAADDAAAAGQGGGDDEQPGLTRPGR